MIAMAETLTLGMRALSYSANVAAEAEGEEISKGSMVGMMLVSLSLAIGIFFLIPVFASDWLETLFGSALLANIAEGIIRLLLFLGYILLIGRMDDIRRVFMYHGAEHMTVSRAGARGPAGCGAYPQVSDGAPALRDGVPAGGDGGGDSGVHLRGAGAVLVADYFADCAGAGNRGGELRGDTGSADGTRGIRW